MRAHTQALGANIKKDTIIFVGLDIHKKIHLVAYVEEERGKTPVHYGNIDELKSALIKFLRKLHYKFPGATILASTSQARAGSGFIDTSLAEANTALSSLHPRK